ALKSTRGDFTHKSKSLLNVKGELALFAAVFQISSRGAHNKISYCPFRARIIVPQNLKKNLIRREM
ncbi:MAG: hypothetical protein ACI8RD_013528, partial [Bacillariaceae sp.]